MRDLDVSLNFNFSRFNSNGWNMGLDEGSVEPSMMGRPQLNHNQQSVLHLPSLLNQPPRPPTSIYNCLQSDEQPQGDIREVDYVTNEPEAKRVNSKQYFRMMKRRIKKVMHEYEVNDGQPLPANFPRPKYLYESRHQHAARRPRGKDGKFLPTRPASERFKEKKKRGRKPKSASNTEQSTGLESQAVS